MSDYGIFSLLPPVIAIVLALKTKQVYVSLILGIWIGWVVINDWNFLDGSVAMVEGLVDVFRSAGNTRTIMFSALVGALLIFIQYSGGVRGFMIRIGDFIERYEEKKTGQSRVVVQVLAVVTGLFLFIETSISSLTVGTLYRPIFDKLKIPREKLAYIADSSSAPSSILIPFNAWGAFIMSLLITQGVENPLSAMGHAMIYNFYPIITILILFAVIFSKKDIGAMAVAEKRTRETGKLMNDDAKPMVSDEITSYKMKEGITPKAYNMIVPLIVMIVMMMACLSYTGWTEVSTYSSVGDHFLKSFSKGSGSSSVLYAVISALIVAMIMYRVQNIVKLDKMVSLCLKGISELMPLALLMLLAFAIGDVCKELETGQTIANWSKDWLTPELLPCIIFVLSSVIAFSTGTSWGTFAIMMAIAIPMSQMHGANLYLVIAATMGGGVFGDHCSPISDTSIISSMASASDHIDHVKTQMPYALVAGGVTAILYLCLGFLL